MFTSIVCRFCSESDEMTDVLLDEPERNICTKLKRNRFMSLFLFTCIDVLLNRFELSVKDMNLLNALRVFEMCKVRFWFFFYIFFGFLWFLPVDVH